MPNFWKSLPKPFLVLAPMEDVTDVVFREIIATYLPRPDVFFTEFVSADGLISGGRDILMRKLTYTPIQRPIVAQIWGLQPENMHKAAQLVKELGFDGVDINFGCPVKDVMKKGAGAGCIGNYPLVKELIAAVKEGAAGIPVSVKTRIGKKTIMTEEWISFLLEQQLDAITIHGRTAKEMSKVPAHWDEVGKAVEMKNKISGNTIMIGNGDIRDYSHAIKMCEEYKVDGVMIGRGIFTDPWVFNKTVDHRLQTTEKMLEILVKHINLFEKTYGTNHFEVMRKYFKIYVKGFDGANEFRQKLMECKNSKEAILLVTRFLN